MIKTIALILGFSLAGCQAILEQNFSEEPTAPETEAPAEEAPPAVILEGRVVLPDGEN